MANSQPATNYALPLELIREICELAAWAFPSSIPRLSLVDHQIRHWVEPGLYRILRIDEDVVQPPVFLRPITEQTQIPIEGPRPINIPYLQKFGRHVRHALLQGCHFKEITGILPHIPGVQHLAIWTTRGRNSELSSLVTCLDDVHEASSLSLKSISCSLLGVYRDFDSVPFHKSYFRDISRLEVVCVNKDDYRRSRWKEISLLDQLTHLCISSRATVSLVGYLLRKRTKLEVLIFFGVGAGHVEDSDSNEQDEEEVGLGRSVGLGTGSTIAVQDDPRVVNMNNHADMLYDWEVGARGGTSFWDVATWVVRERKGSGWSGDSLKTIEFDWAQLEGGE